MLKIYIDFDANAKNDVTFFFSDGCGAQFTQFLQLPLYLRPLQ